MIRVVVSEGNGGGALNLVDFSEGLLRMWGKFCIFAPDFTKTMRLNAIIIVNGEKRMAEMFGHSNNFATLSLSLSLSQALASNTSIKNRGHPRVNIRLSLQKCKGSQLVFVPMRRTDRRQGLNNKSFLYQ